MSVSQCRETESELAVNIGMQLIIGLFGIFAASSSMYALSYYIAGLV